MQDAEAIVVGGGHNGLICAAYLARAGLDTMLVEARSAVGGCASTVSALGARFNICNCDHTLIRAMPVIDELDLGAHGLRYLEAEASYLHLFHDQSSPWLFFSDAERTLEGLSVTHPHQLANYKRYLDEAMPVAELVLEMTKARTTFAELVRTAVGRRAKGAGTLLRWSRIERGRRAWRLLRRLASDYAGDQHGSDGLGRTAAAAGNRHGGAWLRDAAPGPHRTP